MIIELVKSIKNKDEGAIKFGENILSKNITAIAEQRIFYSLPFDQISNIIKKAEFINSDKVKDTISVLQTIIQKTSEVHPI